MRLAKPTFQKNKVEQTIDLEEIFGVDFRGLRSLREAIGEAILARIRERTQSGDGITSYGDNPNFVRLKSPYSKSYAKSIEFQAAGKSKGKVDMTLTGDMLELMDIKKQTGNSLTIGWNDPTENKKAFNHNTGDTLPRRPFFGISKKELKDIRDEFRDDIKAAIEAKRSGDRKGFEDKVSEIFDDIDSIGE